MAAVATVYDLPMAIVVNPAVIPGVDDLAGLIRFIKESKEPLKADYHPEHPLADERGYVYRPNVNTVEELANMISASRSYETNVEVINTSKQLLLRTLSLGQ